MTRKGLFWFRPTTSDSSADLVERPATWMWRAFSVRWALQGQVRIRTIFNVSGSTMTIRPSANTKYS